MVGLLTRLLVGLNRPVKLPSKTVAIVVPVSRRTGLTAEEEVSMRHLLRFLGRHDKYLIAPPGGRCDFAGFAVRHFSRKYFGSTRAHDRLLFLPKFWETFGDYKYILIYHLDALVFRDELLRWCQMDLDYIGAPWIRCSDTPWVREDEERVGNGGFALIKVESVLRVLRNRYLDEPGRYWKDRLGHPLDSLRPILEFLGQHAPTWLSERMRHVVRTQLNKVEKMEVDVCKNDIFLSFHAKKYYPGFKVADFKTGLSFAFEAAPRKCFELNGGNLPFGCHAWTRYDRGFWEPWLLSPDGWAETGRGSLADPQTVEVGPETAMSAAMDGPNTRQTGR